MNYETTVYYRPFTPQRVELRKDWNKKECGDWENFLSAAELKAQKVRDAIDKNINDLSKVEIEKIYFELYGTHKHNLLP